MTPQQPPGQLVVREMVLIPAEDSLLGDEKVAIWLNQVSPF